MNSSFLKIVYKVFKENITKFKLKSNRNMVTLTLIIKSAIEALTEGCLCVEQMKRAKWADRYLQGRTVRSRGFLKIYGHFRELWKAIFVTFVMNDGIWRIFYTIISFILKTYY